MQDLPFCLYKTQGLLNPFVTSGTYMSHIQRVFSKSAGITVSHFFSMLPSTLKYLYSVELVRMHFPVYQWYWVQCCFFSMLPFILKYLYSVELVRMHFPVYK